MYPAKNAYNQRAFVLFWRPFIRVFQALCVSHYSIFHTNRHTYRLIYFTVFSILNIAIKVYTIKHGPHIHIVANNNYKENSLMNYVSFISIAGNFFTHVIAHLEPIFTRKHEVEIYRKLDEINEIFATKLNYVTDFNAIRKKFIRHTVVYFVFASCLAFSYSFYTLPKDGLSMAWFLVGRIISIAVIRGRRCLIAFHINTLTNILMDLQILLKRQQRKYQPNSKELSSDSCERMQHLRDIYSNVYLIKNLLSSCFGWSFITFLLEFSFELINSSYWAYINLKAYKTTNRLKRELF